MSENEAIEFLKGKYPSWGCDEDEYENAITAIHALSEIQQYRAIGTVEEIEKSMQNVSVLLAEHELLKLYQAIGTIEEFKALKERVEPKKLMHNGANWYRCPNGCEVHKKQFEKDWYCPKCGVKLDWSE